MYDLGCERLICVSSVERITLIDSADEDEQRRAEKWRAGEERLMAFCAETQMSFTILRATSVYDDSLMGDFEALTKALTKYPFLPISHGAKGLRQPVHADDIAQALLGALSHLGTKNATYSIGGGEVISLKNLMKRIVKFKGGRSFLIPLPAFILGPLLTVAKLVGLQGVERLNTPLINRMGENMTFDHRRAREDFGYDPRGFLNSPVSISAEE